MAGDRFLVVDVETANSDSGSICQIGVVEVAGAEIVWEMVSLIDPEDDFDWFNISLHGIEPAHVVGQPKMHEVWNELGPRFRSIPVFSYTWFDRSAVHGALGKRGIVEPDLDWRDATMIVRRTWADVAHGGYKLKNVARKLGIKMERHHDALSDAKAAARILLTAFVESGVSLHDWVSKVRGPITPNAKAADVLAKIGQEAVPCDGPLSGENITFTGELVFPRRNAMERAYRAGALVGDSVTKKTTILVVGRQDMQKTHGVEKSSKHLKAEKLISEGQDIEILTEDNFYALVGDRT